MTKKAQVQLGDRVRDELTSFEGIVTGITDWMHGCRHIGVKPESLNKDGAPKDLLWFDEPQVIVIDRGVFSVSRPDPKTGHKTGGPTPSGMTSS